MAVQATRIELDAPAGGRAVATSVRLPATLHRAAGAAVDAGLAGSITELVVAGLDATLEKLAAGISDDRAARDVRTALDAHYAEHPASRPTPVEVARAAALITDHPAAERPDLLAGALADLGDDAFLDDVLAWARGALAIEARTQAAPRVTRIVVLDAEPVGVLLRPRSKKHRQVLAFVEAAQQDRWRRAPEVRVTVPTTVRVEAGWDRQAPGSAPANRLGIADHVLDGDAADRAASLRVQHGVSPADAHVGAAAHDHADGGVVVLTSDPGDIATVTAGTGARIVPL